MSGFHESLDAALGRAGERDVEAVAALIVADTDEPMWSAIVIAKHILASDWLAQRIEQAKAEAWDEGYRAGAEDETGAYWGTGSDTGTTNPYRGGDSHA